MSHAFRANVAAVIWDAQSRRVLMFRRAGHSYQAWQFPQGGVDSGESEEEALHRELREEIGTDAVTTLKAPVRRIRYHYPRGIRKRLQSLKKWRSFRGQQQRWFLVRLECGTDELDFQQHGTPELDAWAWMHPREGLRQVVPFKRKAYRKALRQLGLL